MKNLIIYAHPETGSYCLYILEQIINKLKELIKKTLI